jgi:hypothetical protein
MWRKKDPAVAYLQSLHVAVDQQRFVEIAKAITERGVWEESLEWRISTVKKSRIERSQEYGSPTFFLSVECSYRFQCHCPTLERAVYFEAIYSRLLGDMFYNLGWPSWADRGRLQPVEGETAAT